MVFKKFLSAGIAIAGITAVFGANQVLASGKTYTVNGQSVAPEMQQLLSFYGYKAGSYYIDAYGNFGVSGEKPKGNIDGGMARNWSGREPVGIANNPYAQAYVNGVAGLRVFWVYSPSVFSGATGGSSGFYHICPGNVYYTSSEGSTSVGGDYNSSIGGNNSWAGVAGNSQGGGRWSVQSTANGPVLALNGTDGSRQVLLTTLLQGKFKVGQTKYVIEQNKASCR